MTSDEMGSAGTPGPTPERETPETDPELKDAGEPAEGPADPEGSSGAEEGLNPWAPETYESEPETGSSGAEEGISPISDEPYA